MKKSESIQEFNQITNDSVILNAQFNVFERALFSTRKLPYNRRDFYKISLMIGTGRLLYANRGIELDRPALIFSNPMVPYSWEAVSEEQLGYFCLFNEDFLKVKDSGVSLQESPLFKMGNDPVFFINQKQQDFLTAIFQNIVTEFHTDYIYKLDLIRNYVNVILHEAMKMQPNESYYQHENAASRLSSLFLELLERQFPVDSPQNALQFKTATHYADRLSVHVNHLNHAVREVTGKTTTEHITNRIIAEAKALLQHTTWSVSEIAYSLGYEYPTYFNNFFKKQTGVTPRSLR